MNNSGVVVVINNYWRVLLEHSRVLHQLGPHRTSDCSRRRIAGSKVPALARFLYGQSRGPGRFPGIWPNSLESAPIPWNFARAPNAAAAPVFKLGYLGPVLKQAVVAPNRA